MESLQTKFISSNELLKMRDYARARLTEALAYIQRRATQSPDFLILVVDRYCADLINQLGLR